MQHISGKCVTHATYHYSKCSTSPHGAASQAALSLLISATHVCSLLTLQLGGTAPGFRPHAGGHKLARLTQPGCLQDVLAHPSNSSIVNATRGTVTGAASAAAGALATASITVSNATAALAAATNTTAVNVTNTTMAAGGAESDALLGNEVLNSTVAHGVLHSGADKVTGALSGAKSWLSSSKADDVKQGKIPHSLQAA